MLGTKSLFPWHLTMLRMEEHAFEFVLRARLDAGAEKRWLADRSQHPDETYFLGNVETDVMTIPGLAIGARTSFTASIWAGIPVEHQYCSWPWEGIKPVVANTKLTVERVAYRHFDFQENYPENLTYLLFGDGDEAHLGHVQTRQPDFDEVISLAAAPTWLPPDLLQAGVHVDFPGMPATPVYCSPPLLQPTYQVQHAGNAMPTYEISIDRVADRAVW
jgi:hypothetical protein